MEILTAAIFATCLKSTDFDYKWECVDFINNCAISKKGKIIEEKVEECVMRWKDGERYEEPK